MGSPSGSEPMRRARSTCCAPIPRTRSADETPERLTQKHRLQAEVYADVLHKAGYEQVTLKFVRVEVPDLVDPAQPQVVEYRL